jgi:hypothetical protein
MPEAPEDWLERQRTPPQVFTAPKNGEETHDERDDGAQFV